MQPAQSGLAQVNKLHQIAHGPVVGCAPLSVVVPPPVSLNTQPWSTLSQSAHWGLSHCESKHTRTHARSEMREFGGAPGKRRRGGAHRPLLAPALALRGDAAREQQEGERAQHSRFVPVVPPSENIVAAFSSPMRYSKGSEPKSIAKKCDGSTSGCSSSAFMPSLSYLARSSSLPSTWYASPTAWKLE